jgi:hypothetical protein
MTRAIQCLAVVMVFGCGGRSLESGSDSVPPGAETTTPNPPASPVPEAAGSVRGRVATYGPAGEGIALYPADLSASSQPLTTLEGDWHTNACVSLSFDSAGNVYALCYQAVPSEPPSQIDVFSANATGSAAPRRVITGPETTLNEAAINLAVDGPGNVYVVQYCQLAPTCSGMISVFAPGANGNVAPIRVIQGPHTGFDRSAAIAVDAAGQIYVGNAEGGPILVFSADAHDDATPIRRIGRAQDIGDVTNLAVDASGTVYAAEASYAHGVLVYGPSAAEGDAPDRVIAGPATGLDGDSGVAVDRAGRLLVADDSHDVDGLSGTVSIFAPGASGNEAPDTVLSGVGGFGLAIAP